MHPVGWRYVDWGHAMQGKVIQLKVDDIHYTLTRLYDRQHYTLQRRSLVIADDYGFYMHFYNDMRSLGQALNFAQVYVALQSLCGESGILFDEWKSSYTFPFLLKVCKAEQTYDYLLTIYNYRDTLYFGIRRVCQPGEEQHYDQRVIHQPFPNEFSRQEINCFIGYFYAYLGGYFEVIGKYYDTFFFKRVDANMILFGYKEGEYFETAYDTEDEYEQAISKLEQHRARHEAHAKADGD